MHIKPIVMKRVAWMFVSALILLSACGPKPYYLTHEGKKKQRYYNSIQYGQDRPVKNFR